MKGVLNNLKKLVAGKAKLGRVDMAALVLSALLVAYALYLMVANREFFSPSVDPYREDEATANYYINEDVHVGQKGLLDKFVKML
jgi:hypothetical protein